jgi:predicted DNA-binding protein (MmcQ/YjbR family)
MDIESLREYCLSKPGVEESLPFGPDVLVFKSVGKIFLIAPLSAERWSFSVKCNPELAEELRARHPAVQPGYHLNKKHWNTVYVDGSLSRVQLRHFVDHSYDLVTGKSLKKSKPPPKAKRR